jgi:hypothetical protein
MKSLLAVIVLSVAMHAQSFTASGSSALPAAPAATQRPFWTVDNKVNVGILAGLVSVDGITTERGLSEGFREANPVMRPFVTRGATGSVAGFGLGFGTSVGVAYLLHRTHHYKAERVAMRLMVAGEAGFVTNNLVQLR